MENRNQGQYNNNIEKEKRAFKNIVNNGPNPEDVKIVEKFVEDKGKDWSNSQLRNVYDTLVKIKETGTNVGPQISKFLWKFAYVVGKDKKDKKESPLKMLYDCFKEASTVLTVQQTKQNDDKFNHLKELFECIIAYHRFYHGDRKR
jgi:CRISPR type III-A-associated protein Csm2